MDEKMKEDLKEKSENLDKPLKATVPLRLNKKWVIGIISVFVILFAYGFFKASTPKQEKKEEQQQTETLASLDTESFNNNDILIEQERKRKSEEQQTAQLVEVDKVQKKAEVQKDNGLDQYFIEQLQMERELLKAYYTQLLQEEQDARTSAITFKNLNTPQKDNSSVTLSNNGIQTNGSTPMLPIKDPNGQADKKKFLRGEDPSAYYNNHTEMYPISPYEIKAGSIIPGVMITATVSDLPGEMIGQVRENVYDTVTGNHLLIPKGTRIQGRYDSSVTFGQERILVVWQRLIFPNGKSIGLDNMPGVDLSGYAGFKGKVNNHYFKLLQTVVLSSFMGAGEAIITRDEYGEDDWRYEAGRGGGEVAIEFGNKMAERILDQQPSINVPMAYRFNIIVNSDLVLTPYEE